MDYQKLDNIIVLWKVENVLLKIYLYFQFMFHKPIRVTNWLLVITWALVIYQFVLLVQATEWSHIISLAFLLFCNYYMLFKLMRDRLVLSRAYKDEQIAMQQS